MNNKVVVSRSPETTSSAVCTSGRGENKIERNRKRNEMNWRTKKHHMILSAHLSVPAGFIIVSFPEEAAFTIWFSTDLFILALSAYDMIQQGGKNEEDGGTSLVHGCLLDGSRLFRCDRTAAFLRVGGCLVRTSCVVVGLTWPAFGGSLDHCM